VNALAIMTGGHVCPPMVAMQQCLAARRGLVKPVGVKVCRVPEVVARVATPACQRPPVIEVPAAAPKPKVEVQATKRKPMVAHVAVKETSPAPSDSGPLGPPSTNKPTVRVKKNGNGKKRPTLKMKKKLT
jgi:hypothetical protein